MLRCGTRGSALARTQSQTVVEEIERLTGRRCELVVIRAEGDELSVPLAAPPRPGAFVATLRDALLDGRVDLVVHSYKDLPSAPVMGLTLAAVPPRAPAADVLVSATGAKLADLSPASSVGTSSPRRASALRRARPDLRVVPLRGNVDSRLLAVRTGRVDAAVLAAAGLTRLGRLDEASEILDPSICLPAPAQGALAVECRTGSPICTVVSVLDHRRTRVEVSAERAVLDGVAATCTTAVGASASWLTDRLELVAELADHAGVDHATRFGAVDLPDEADLAAAVAAARGLGLTVAAELIGAGHE